MAELNGITINIGVTVSEETVRRCCEILGIYFQDNPNKGLELFRSKDGHGNDYAIVCIKEVTADDRNSN